jgi:hypothetical protein
MNGQKRSHLRLVLVVVAVIALCITTITFADSTYSTGNGNAYGNDKLEASLAYLNSTMLQATDTLGVNG